MVATFKNYQDLSAFAANKIIRLVKHKKNAVLCLAAGDTPALTYHLVVETAKREAISFSEIIFTGLDEWVGIGPDIPGSCYYFLQQKIFGPLGIKKTQIHFFNSMATDLQQECNRINTIIQTVRGIDFALVGIGLNGHVGFNEPGIDAAGNAHVVALDEVTSNVGQKYFKTNTALSKGITLGMAQIMQAREVLLLANGAKKAAIIRRTLKEDISNAVPAGFITTHPNGWILLDEEAAAEL